VSWCCTHDLKPGERRPVVVVQHGRGGLPENLIVKDHGSYRRVAAQLAEGGFIVMVPHNLYRTELRYRPLNRKANTVKATLYSFIVHQHDQMLRWLNTLEFVAGDRIAFYGNSFGGEAALRVPSVLEGYALSICASYFNQWTRKVASTEDPFSYLFQRPHCHRVLSGRPRHAPRRHPPFPARTPELARTRIARPPQSLRRQRPTVFPWTR
jgi:hypothetical protein